MQAAGPGEIRKWLWMTLGGGLYCLAMPPWGWWWALPLALAVWGMVKEAKAWQWWLVGTLVWMCLLAWLTPVSVAGWLVLAALTGATVALPMWLYGRGRAWWAVAAVWIAVEGLRGMLGWGWLPLAAGWTQAGPLVAWAQLGGQGLVGFYALALGLGLAELVKAKGQPKLLIKQVRAYLGLWTVVLAGGVYLQYVAGSAATGQTVRIGWVQPAVPMIAEGKTDADTYNELQALRSGSNQLKNEKMDFILWPEQATPWPANDDRTLRGWVEDGARYLRVPIVSGVLWHEGGQYYNAAGVIDPVEGVAKEAYRKRRLVPLGEYIPLMCGGWMRSLTPIVESFAAGEKPVVLKVKAPGDKTLKLWPLICYEDTFPELVAGAAQQAEMIVVFVNNEWFGWGARQQHAAHTVLRAVEQGLPVLRVANGGLSGWVMPNGQTRYLPEGKPQAAVMEVPLVKVETILAHSAWGWQAGWMLMGLMGILLWPKRGKPPE